jgi:hypothetical protein
MTNRKEKISTIALALWALALVAGVLESFRVHGLNFWTILAAVVLFWAGLAAARYVRSPSSL